MSKLRWAKLWWQDWSDDPGLRLCSLAAQGLWMRLMCIAAAAEPYGYVLVNHKPPSNADIARIVGAHSNQIAKLLAELEAQGVYSTTGDGVMFSRRMVRDAAESSLKREVGALGGNPALRSHPPPHPGNGLDNRLDKHQHQQSPESHAESESTPQTPRVRGGRARGAQSRNAFSDSLNDDLGVKGADHAEARHARRGGATVVAIPRRA